MAKLPAYIIEFQIAMDGVKRYTGWTDVEVAKHLGVSHRTVQRARQDPCSVNGGFVLQVQDILFQLRKKAGAI